MFNSIGVRVAVAAVAANPCARTLTSFGSALVGTTGAGVAALPVLKALGVVFVLTLPFHWKVSLPLMAIGALVAVAAFKVFAKINGSSANFNIAVHHLLKKGYTLDQIEEAINRYCLFRQINFEEFISQQSEGRVEELTNSFLNGYLNTN